jgi:hypothetical protein
MKLGGRHASSSLVAGCTRHRNYRVNAYARDLKFRPVLAGLFRKQQVNLNILIDLWR